MTSTQDSHITNLKKAAIWRYIPALAKVGLWLLLLTYIVVELFQQQDIGLQFQNLTMNLWTRGWDMLVGTVIILMPLNWLLESIKWQLLLKDLTKVSLTDAIKGVLTGLTLGFVTPHSLGDYLGRIWHLESENRMESFGAILLGRGAQFLSTLLFGIWGLWYWCLVDVTGWGQLTFWFTLYLISILMVMFLFFRQRFVNICYRYWPWAAKFIKVLSNYSKAEVLKICALSLLRYAVFALQFFLLLYWVGIQVPPDILFAGVTWVLLAKSVLPAFNFLSDLGVREFSALYFFGLFQIPPAPVLTASLSLWVLNILLPTLLGAGYIMQLKIFKS